MAPHIILFSEKKKSDIREGTRVRLTDIHHTHTEMHRDDANTRPVWRRELFALHSYFSATEPIDTYYYSLFVIYFFTTSKKSI